MRPHTLVAGIGNIFMGDDGFGCEVVRRLDGVDVPDGVRVVDYGIRGMHLAYDRLDGWDLLILVDAVPDSGMPGRLEVMEIRREHLGAGELEHMAWLRSRFWPASASWAATSRPRSWSALRFGASGTGSA